MEENEDMESCATREVMEETGLNHVEIIRLLTKTYHIYMEEEFIFKETYWFLMHSDEVVLHPQLDEGIQKAVWINRNNVGFQLKNTYKSIKDIVALVS
jgi:8-oxo-dGTP pyrophosphatase MutT (NUDIX family)